MKKWILMAMICGMAALAQGAEWLTDLPNALKQAKAENKLVLMDFTGSDWCPPCKELHTKVLTSPEFVSYAAKNLVLVVVDFPQKDLPAALAASNNALKDKFSVEGFPTVIVLDKQGKQLTKELGYEGESPKEFIAKLEKLKEKGS